MKPLAIVTGASGGLGLALCQELAAQDWQVIAVTRHPEALPAIPNVTTVKATITNPADREAVCKAAAKYGAVSLLINNAGTAGGDALEACSPDDVHTVFDVNVFAPLALTQLLLPTLKEQCGCVVNISSLAGTVPLPFLGAYSASKHALNAATIAQHLELLHSGVRFRLVEAGPLTSKLCSDGIGGATAEYEVSQPSMKLGLQRLSKHYGTPTCRAAKQIIRSVTSSTPFKRVIIGWWTRVVLLLHKMLPTSVSQRLLARIYNITLRS